MNPADGHSHIAQRPLRRRLARAGRVALGGGLLVLAYLILAHPVAYRSFEVSIATPLTGLITPGSILHLPGRDVFVVGAGTSRFWTFQLTRECTTAILIVPLLGIGGVLLLAGQRFAVRRVVRAILLTGSIVMAVNLLRLAGIAWAAMTWDDPGYEASHTFIGSGFSFTGFCVAIALGARSLLAPDRPGDGA